MGYEPTDQTVIDADIDIAKMIYYQHENSDRSVKNNPMMMNMSAYHSAQAIEKSLKFLIYKDTGTESHTHNISELLVDVELKRPNFIQEHKDIANNVHYITGLNGARYGGREISRETAKKMLDMSRDLFKEICKEFGKPQYEMLQPKDKEEKSHNPKAFHNKKRRPETNKEKDI